MNKNQIVRLESRPGVCVGYQVNFPNGDRYVQPIGARGYTIPAAPKPVQEKTPEAKDFFFRSGFMRPLAAGSRGGFPFYDR